jgi:type VI secretion system ImpM family protein
VEAHPVHGFGKLPIHGDFVRVNRTVPQLLTFDNWFQEGIHRVRQAVGRGFDERFDGAIPQRFLELSPSRGELFAGVCMASRDRANRRFPFVLGAIGRLPATAAALRELPYELDEFLNQAEVESTTGWRDRSLPEFQERAGALCWLRDTDAARAACEHGLATHASNELWDTVLPGAPNARRAALLAAVRDLLRPVPPKLVLRLPTSGAPEQIAFWLALIAHWTPVDALPNLVTWHAAVPPRQGVITLLFDRLNGRYFEPVFWPTVENDHAYDPASEQAADRVTTTTNLDALAELVAGTATLGELLARVVAALA